MSVMSKAELDTDFLGDVSEDSLVRDLSDDAFIDFFADEKFNSRDLMDEHIGRLGEPVESDDDADDGDTSRPAGLPEIDLGGDSEGD